MDTIRKYSLISKQAVAQKLFSVEKSIEPLEFRAAADSFKLTRTQFEAFVNGLTAFVNQEGSTGSAARSVVEAATALSTVIDGPLGPTSAKISEMIDQLEAFRTEFVSESLESVGPVASIRDVHARDVDPVRTFKKEYNKLRYERDALKAKRDHLLSKSGTKPDKIRQAEAEFGPVDAKYREMQQQFQDQAAYARAMVTRSAGLELCRTLTALTAFYGQAYRILSEYQPVLESAQRDYEQMAIPVRPVNFPPPTGQPGEGAGDEDSSPEAASSTLPGAADLLGELTL
jgi:hypothetical protein